MAHSHLLKSDKALQFTLGGNATFTIKSLATQTRFTYKVQKIKNDNRENSIRFVRLMNGSCNESSFVYIGYLKYVQDSYQFFHGGNKSKVGIDAPSVRAFDFVFKMLKANINRNDVEFWHEGTCCRCGRKLTTPESVENGIGSECSKMSKK